mmetsp:Transcript_30685/g.53841  ORF Transcript_30685/g.53841 Transcript_30685/m.53841 type:complete len:150 (-) Transcript_30685:476-925(-)|eukprot:CAMPEP_0197515372 /NCGR_PEP_ID=MMETSP1318-20131121/531_1 /TAXON_ID=552666 /ORGANISM="Partenskyella glossopodia, Strain RCC365" /LENGTH=149 /DNA_ID=CAMNT_0043063731 /DNA_START=142 /DNA_END=591 /DNA_ORIENTATION=+
MSTDNKDAKTEHKKTLAEAHDEGEEELTWGEWWENCKKDCSFNCFHVDELGTPLYCWNTPRGWGELCLFFFLLYGFLAAFFSLLLFLSQEYGTDVLWGYLAVFLCFVIGLAVVLYFGHKEHLQRETVRAASRRMIEGDMKKNQNESIRV